YQGARGDTAQKIYADDGTDDEAYQGFRLQTEELKALRGQVGGKSANGDGDHPGGAKQASQRLREGDLPGGEGKQETDDEKDDSQVHRVGVQKLQHIPPTREAEQQEKGRGDRGLIVPGQGTQQKKAQQHEERVRHRVLPFPSRCLGLQETLFSWMGVLAGKWALRPQRGSSSGTRFGGPPRFDRSRKPGVY